MPELPEVETTLAGIAPHITKQTVKQVIIRTPHLRWPIPTNLSDLIVNQTLEKITRRGKYLLFHFATGTMILHLGMSGRTRVLTDKITAQKHDHVDIIFANNICLRFTDPRRFGALLFTENNPDDHPLIKDIGPEPLSNNFDGDYLWTRAQGKKVVVKSFIMDSKVVAGVGNIYATESLFAAGIDPKKSAGKVTREKYQLLSKAIKNVLAKAITKGGTTLKDFTKSDGSPGYFSIELKVYGKNGKPCVVCKSKLQLIQIAKRSTVYCKKCQK